MKMRDLSDIIAVGLGILALPLWCTATQFPDLTNPAHSNAGRHLVSPALPFSFEQVLSCFDDAFGKTGYKVHDDAFVFIDPDSPDGTVRVDVSAAHRKITVSLFARGNQGVNYLREFFEAPFFRRSESEQLYALLEAKDGLRSAAFGRFHVKIGVFKTRERIIITSEFGPPGG